MIHIYRWAQSVRNKQKTLIVSLVWKGLKRERLGKVIFNQSINHSFIVLYCIVLSLLV